MSAAGQPPPVFNGLFNTQAGWRAGVVTETLAADLVMRNCGDNFLTNPAIPTFVAILAYCNIRCINAGVNLVGSLIAYCICEMLAFGIPDGQYLAQPQAQARILADVRAFFPLTARNITQQAWAHGYNMVSQIGNINMGTLTPNTDISQTHSPVAASAPPNAQRQHIVTDFDDAVIVLRILSVIWYGRDRRSLCATIYTCFLVAIAKMGTMSIAFKRKIERSFLADLGYDISANYFDRDIIRTVWNTLKTFVNENNIQNNVNNWSNWIPNEALRLKITASQIAGEGLTAITVVKQAFSKFPGFDWNAVYVMFPNEFTNIHTAFQTIGNNQYYGYVQDTTRIKSTLYKNVAWVCKELMIRSGGMQSLSQYSGWIGNPEHRQELDTLINNYINNPQPRPAATPAQAATCSAVMQAAQACQGIQA